MRRFIDDFSVHEVSLVLQALRPSEKALILVKAHASAPNRARSRLELARSLGSEKVNTCNGVYGNFAKSVAMALDPGLAEEWRPADGPAHDWVLFLSTGPARWFPPSDGERDRWVFVMRETLARAIDSVGWAPYVELDPRVQAMLDDSDRDDSVEPAVDDGDDTWHPVDPFDEIDAVEDELEALDETEREAVVLARIGQGTFRELVIEAWGGCCAVTGASFLPALVASHIKPWVDCTNKERLDASNGLLLVGTLDRLFDGGFITFDVDGRMLISPFIPPEEYKSLGVSRALRLRSIPPGSIQYLLEHRRDYFLEEDEARGTA